MSQINLEDYPWRILTLFFNRENEPEKEKRWNKNIIPVLTRSIQHKETTKKKKKTNKKYTAKSSDAS